MSHSKHLTAGFDQQKEAVLSTEGKFKVIACAGAGKTRALTKRYEYIINILGTRPHNILIITFTNKAASEIRNRIIKTCGQKSDETLIKTFHGFCVNILRRDIKKLGLATKFHIYDNTDQMDLLRLVYDENKIDPKQLKYKEAITLTDFPHI